MCIRDSPKGVNLGMGIDMFFAPLIFVAAALFLSLIHIFHESHGVGKAVCT